MSGMRPPRKREAKPRSKGVEFGNQESLHFLLFEHERSLLFAPPPTAQKNQIYLITFPWAACDLLESSKPSINPNEQSLDPSILLPPPTAQENKVYLIAFP